MAINFLNTVAFNQNSVEKLRIENQPNDAAAGTGVEGQLYFDTTVDALKIYAGGAWVEVGATSGVETFTNTSGTYVAFGTNNSSAIGNVTVGTVDLTAVDGTSTAADRFLTKANKWATIPFGDITDVNGGTYITTVNSTGPVVTVNHDLTSRTDTTSTVSANVFPVVDSVSTNTTGHVTAINVKTVTVPDNNTTYTLPVTAGSLSNPKSGIITLTGTDSSTDPVTFVGTTGRIEIAGNSIASTITVDLTDDVSIVGKIDVLGSATSSFAGDIDMNNNKLTEVKTGTVATDGVNLGQVEALVAGIGLFKGGYNATTGLTTDLGAGNGSLDGASNIALDQGDFFVVTVAGGAFYTQTLEVGDMIFANTTIAANSTPPISDYTVVIQDANIAGAGATDGATAKGVAGFDSASFNVSASGWVQLDAQKNPNGAKQSLNNTAPSTRTESGGVTTFTLNLAAASLFGSGALSQNVKAEVTEGSAPYETVYACVTRSGTASMAIGFTGSVANDAYQVLLTHV